MKRGRTDDVSGSQNVCRKLLTSAVIVRNASVRPLKNICVVRYSGPAKEHTTEESKPASLEKCSTTVPVTPFPHST